MQMARARRMVNIAPPPGRFPAATAPRCASTNPLNDAEWGGRFVVMIGTQATLPVSSSHEADQRSPAYSQRSRVLSTLRAGLGIDPDNHKSKIVASTMTSMCETVLPPQKY